MLSMLITSCNDVSPNLDTRREQHTVNTDSEKKN